MAHIIKVLARIFGKVHLQELTATTVDDTYGTAISTTFATTRDIYGVILREPRWTDTKMQQDWGMQTRATPSLMVPEDETIPLGSRVSDDTTTDTFEVVNQVGVFIHPKAVIRACAAYKEYELRKIQAGDGGAI